MKCGIWHRHAFSTTLILAIWAGPSFGHPPDPFKIPKNAIAEPHLNRVTKNEAKALIASLQYAQLKLAASEATWFDLYLGAPASYDVTDITPRAAFLKMQFDRAFLITRVGQSKPLPETYRIVISPHGNGELIWQITINTNADHGTLNKVEMYYGPPAPY